MLSSLTKTRTEETETIPMRETCDRCIDGCIRCVHMDYRRPAPHAIHAHTYCLIERAWIEIPVGMKVR